MTEDSGKPLERDADLGWYEAYDPVDAADLSAERLEQASADDRLVVDRPGHPRAGAMAGYRLDPASEHAAREVGREVADRLREVSWAEASLEQRRDLARDVHRDVTRVLGTETPALEFEGLAGAAGLWREGRITIDESLLSQPDAQDVIETIAHEERHAWQAEVIQGRRRHPAGREARQDLVDANDAYSQDLADFESYAANEMERDAEAFAWLTYDNYLKRQASSR